MENTTISKNRKSNAYANPDKLISKALRCLEGQLRYTAGEVLTTSQNVCNYLRLQLAQERNEVFSVLFLDNHHRLLAFEKMFYGTINESVVYPRGVIQKALEFNASAVIMAHNHPSGNIQPSQADIKLTEDLKNVLGVMNIKMLDHIIVSHQETLSFAEQGLL